MSEQHRPTDGLVEQLDSIERKVDAAARDAAAARDESEQTNGRLVKLEDTVYGPSEKRVRESDPGLLAKVAETRALAFDLSTARDESAAVRSAMRWIIGLGVSILATMVAALGLMASIAGMG